MQRNNPYLLKEQLWKILSNNRGQLDTSFYKDIALSSFFLFAVNKKYELQLKKGIKKQIKIVLYQNFPQESQIKEITEELFSVLESEEEIIQNFNREYERVFI